MIRTPTTDTDHKALHLYLAVFGAPPNELVGTRDATEAVGDDCGATVRFTTRGVEIRIRQAKKKIKVLSVQPTWPKQRDEAIEKWESKK